MRRTATVTTAVLAPSLLRARSVATAPTAARVLHRRSSSRRIAHILVRARPMDASTRVIAPNVDCRPRVPAIVAYCTAPVLSQGHPRGVSAPRPATMRRTDCVTMVGPAASILRARSAPTAPTVARVDRRSSSRRVAHILVRAWPMDASTRVIAPSVDCRPRVPAIVAYCTAPVLSRMAKEHMAAAAAVDRHLADRHHLKIAWPLRLSAMSLTPARASGALAEGAGANPLRDTR